MHGVARCELPGFDAERPALDQKQRAISSRS
jgi:hypothetical protein